MSRRNGQRPFRGAADKRDRGEIPRILDKRPLGRIRSDCHSSDIHCYRYSPPSSKPTNVDKQCRISVDVLCISVMHYSKLDDL